MSDLARRNKRSRQKGADFELEVRDAVRAHGWNTAHRNFQSGGQGGGDLADAIPDWHIECKRTETVSLASWWKQATKDARATDTVLVAHRGNFQPIQATGLLTDLFPIVQTLPVDPIVCGRSFRPVFLAEVKNATATRRPMVIHSLGDQAMVTVLFEDLLGELAARRPVREFCSCPRGSVDPECGYHGMAA